MKSCAVLFVFVVLGPSLPCVAQTAPPDAQRRGDLEAIAKGWSALAAGRPAEAEALAGALLAGSPRRHEAAMLLIRARILAGRDLAALDGYEQWAAAVRQEDVFLLQPIAIAVLDTLSASTDRSVRIRALGALAAEGDARARARLTDLAAASSGGEADEVLAAAADPGAIERLRATVTAAGGRDVSRAIDALRDANARGAIGAIAAALATENAVPTRMAAARALGALDAREAIPQLRRASQDPEGPVRLMANAALARLGDPAGQEALRALENSPVLDIRLLAVEASAATSPDGAWLPVALSGLQDPDPLVRLNAAGLIAKYAKDPRPGVDAIQQALADPNPALQFAASRELDRLPATVLAGDVAKLRRLLRSVTAEVRIAAASGVLRLAGGVD